MWEMGLGQAEKISGESDYGAPDSLTWLSQVRKLQYL
jgi:hypothetical protein